MAVNRISFAVRRGTTTALLGGNGAGKTTTLSMLLGLLTPSGGRATVLGAEMPARAPSRAAADEFHVAVRRPAEAPHRRREPRASSPISTACAGRAERIAAVAADCDLADLLRRPYGSLSAGQRTRVSLAKAVLNEPDVLLLDEPTASLDPDIGDRMRTYLERYQHRTGCTMLLASHHMGEVERMCDDVIMLRAGEVVDQGSPRALIERYGRETMEEVFLDVARGRADDAPCRRCGRGDARHERAGRSIADRAVSPASAAASRCGGVRARAAPARVPASSRRRRASCR